MVGGLYTPSDGHAEPVKATQALADAAVKHGARLYPRCAVEGIDTEGGRVSGVRTESGPVRARTVVCAAGAWSARVIRPLGLRLPQRWVRATVARTGPAPPLTRAGVRARRCRSASAGTARSTSPPPARPTTTSRSSRFATRGCSCPNYWKNRKLFRFHLGRPLLRDLAGLWPGPRPAVGRSHGTGTRPEPQPGQGGAEPRGAPRPYPALGELAVTRSWAGYIDATPDAIPVVGEVGPTGLVLATGFTGHGFAMGLMSAG